MKIKQLAKSKTLWVSLATVCTGVGLFFGGEQTLQDLIITFVGIVFAIIRFYTSVPLEKK